MIKLCPYDSTSFQKGMVLNDAYSVRVTQEINGNHILEFSHPINEKSDYISENKIVFCEGQAYRIIKAVKNIGEISVINVECHHVYNADAPNIHIQNIPDMIGVKPTDVLKRAFNGTKFTLMSDSELQSLGMRRVDYDGFLIDFFSVDKTNPFDVVKTVIENCGKGEIYVDNYKIALVERIGKNTNIRLDLAKNMQNISVERDITDMVTRLYPYGRDDAHIGSVNGGRQYIESANASIYGVREGYRDYTDYIKPNNILSRAMWEFDIKNEERIDVPCINITGAYADISKLAEYGDSEKLHLGDGVTVIDNGNEISERIIKIEYYPYQSDNTVISIGRVKKDLYFYLNQMGKLTRNYSKVSTSSGKVKAKSVLGTITNTGLSVTTPVGEVSIVSDMIKITNGGTLKLQIGNLNGKFICKIMDNGGNCAVQIMDDGKMMFTGDFTANQIIMGNNKIKLNSSGQICINDKVIRTS